MDKSLKQDQKHRHPVLRVSNRYNLLTMVLVLFILFWSFPCSNTVATAVFKKIFRESPILLYLCIFDILLCLLKLEKFLHSHDIPADQMTLYNQQRNGQCNCLNWVNLRRHLSGTEFHIASYNQENICFLLDTYSMLLSTPANAATHDCL